MKIGIINNSLGNIGSLQTAFNFYKYDVILAKTSEELKKSDVLILAGVGHFKKAVSLLKELNLWDNLNNEVLIKKKPIVGICLGMQLFADMSNEDGETAGFGWISGEVKKIKGEGVRVPHMGWNFIVPLDKKIFTGMQYNSFYFMHSYHFIPQNKNVIIAKTDYGNIEIVSAVRKDNIIGLQFHPEKSQGDGLRIIRNIIEEFK